MPASLPITFTTTNLRLSQATSALPSWKTPRILTVLFQHVQGNGLDQFKDTSAESDCLAQYLQVR